MSNMYCIQYTVFTSTVIISLHGMYWYVCKGVQSSTRTASRHRRVISTRLLFNVSTLHQTSHASRSSLLSA